MKILLEFLSRYCLSLFEKHGFKFSDSGMGRNPAAGAWVLLDSKDMQIYICNERDELTWEMRSLHDSNKKNWFSIDLISKLLGHSTDTGLMNTDNCDFLSENMDEIMARFREEEAQDTIVKLHKLEIERAKRM